LGSSSRAEREFPSLYGRVNGGLRPHLASFPVHGGGSLRAEALTTKVVVELRYRGAS
jgi:hypothetical protein